MNALSLFTGIGGLDLSAQLAGINIVGMVEYDPNCQKFLREEFPEVPLWRDIREFDPFVTGYTTDMGRTQDSKYAEAVTMYASGLSVGEVAEVFKTSRQAMWKILARRGTNFRPRIKYGKDKSTHDRVEKALTTRTLTRATVCEICGCLDMPNKDGSSGLIGHHEDYSKPLEVVWLCRKCHYRVHNHGFSKREVIQGSTTAVDIVIGGPP